MIKIKPRIKATFPVVEWIQKPPSSTASTPMIRGNTLLLGRGTALRAARPRNTRVLNS